MLLFITASIPIILVLSPKDADTAWLIAGYFFFGFIMMNMVAFWFAHDTWKYFFHSLSFSIAYLLLIAIVMPNIINILGLTGEAESARVFLMFVYHPLGLLLAMVARWISYKIAK